MIRIVLAVMAISLATPVLAQSRPNIVYILIDNWGWGRSP